MNAFLQSERIALRPIQRADIPALMALSKDRGSDLVSDCRQTDGKNYWRDGFSENFHAVAHF